MKLIQLLRAGEHHYAAVNRAGRSRGRRCAPARQAAFYRHSHARAGCAPRRQCRNVCVSAVTSCERRRRRPRAGRLMRRPLEVPRCVKMKTPTPHTASTSHPTKLILNYIKHSPRLRVGLSSRAPQRNDARPGARAPKKAPKEEGKPRRRVAASRERRVCVHVRLPTTGARWIRVGAGGEQGASSR